MRGAAPEHHTCVPVGRGNSQRAHARTLVKLLGARYRISYEKHSIQEYATMPGRDTAPGFLFAVVSPKRPVGPGESKLRKRNNRRSGTAIQVTAQPRRADGVLYFSCI
jgi:hypothetical protein